MADYKDLKGGTVQNVAGDPPAPIAGQVWYDSTASAFQYRSSNPAGTWATTSALNTAREQVAGAGTTTSGLVFGENFGGETELYNGTNWTEVNDLNTSRRGPAGAGASNTAALAFGGNLAAPSPNAATDETETWNGTNWTEVNDLNQARVFLTGAGTNTAAIAIGGATGAGGNPPQTGEAETWN